MFASILSAYTANQIIILNHIRQHGPLTRSQLVEISGFKLLTVTKTVTQLLSDGILCETGQKPSSGGRRPTLLTINPHFRYTLSADIGRTNCRVAVVGMDCSIIEEQVIATDRKPGCHLTQEEFLLLLQKLIAKYGKEKILGLGIGITGMVRYKDRYIEFCPNIQGWNEVDVTRSFAEKLGIPVLVDTTARCIARAEHTLGAGQGINNLICVSLGASIAAGIILDGKIYRGVNELAGEIGHVTVREDGQRCSCGNYGCLENYANFPMIQGKIRKTLKDYVGYSPLRKLCPDGEVPTIEQVKEALAMNDPVVLQVLESLFNVIASALSYLTNILNPQMIVLGGRTIEHFPILVNMVEKALKHRSTLITLQSLTLRPSMLKSRAALVGSSLLVIDAFFEGD